MSLLVLISFTIKKKWELHYAPELHIDRGLTAK